MEKEFERNKERFALFKWASQVPRKKFENSKSPELSRTLHLSRPLSISEISRTLLNSLKNSERKKWRVREDANVRGARELSWRRENYRSAGKSGVEKGNPRAFENLTVVPPGTGIIHQ
eukprot:1333213-Amorphochlora_amoeboformis.AAC.1